MSRLRGMRLVSHRQAYEFYAAFYNENARGNGYCHEENGNNAQRRRLEA